MELGSNLEQMIEYYKNHSNNIDKIEFFKKLLNEDSFFLNHKFVVDFDDENYEFLNPCGFCEIDFKNILYLKDELGLSKVRLAIAIFNGLNISNLKDTYKSKRYKEVLLQMFIKGDYDKFGIEDASLIKKLLKDYGFPFEDFVDACFFRGVYLSERDSTQDEEMLST